MSMLSAVAAAGDEAAMTELVLLPARADRQRGRAGSAALSAGTRGQDTSSDARVLQLRLVRPSSARFAERPGSVLPEAQRGVAGGVARRPASPAAAQSQGRRTGAAIAARPDAAGQAASWRLTRRGRMVVMTLGVLVAVCTVLALWLATATRAQAAGHAQPARAGYRGLVRIVVQPGQTLWSIAAAAEPQARTAAVIQQITDANALRSGTLYAGELLWVPRA